MRKLLFALALLITTASYAQNRATIKGKVTDSITHEAMELSTIAIVNLKDTASSLVSYTVSDKKGEFTLHNLPAGIPLKVLITFVAYKPYRKFLTLSKGETIDLGTIALSQKNLQEVSINAERPPIVIRKDTIEFNAEAFKTRPNAMVEDLLKKLPGVEVANDGTITVVGKPISKILVDGREFFANDPRIASKNLDADMIDKVQIYDDREDDPDHLVEDARVKKIINLKFKQKLKKSIFGKVYGGVGSEGRYEAAGLLNMFRDTLQVSLLGLSNNLSNTGFGYSDVAQYAGSNRGGDALGRGGASSGFSSNGLQQTTSDGININTDYGKKLKLNLSYYYSHIRIDNNSISNRQQFLSNINQQSLNDTVFTTNTTNNRFSVVGRHNLSALIRIQPNDATQIKYSPLFTYSDNLSGSGSMANSFSNYVPQITNSGSSDNNSGNNLQFQHEFDYNHQFKKQGESLTIGHNLNINPSASTDYNNTAVTSYISTFSSYSQNRFTDNENKNLSTNLSIAYRYPVNKKLITDVNLGSDYSRSVNTSSIFDINPVTGQYDSFLSTISSDLTRTQLNEHVNEGITYNFSKKLSLIASLSEQWQQIGNHFDKGYADLDKNYFFVLPSVRLTLFGASLSYSQSVSQPYIGDVIPYSVVFSPLYSVTGNPDLKPTTRNNFSLNYNKFDPQRSLSFFFNSGFSFDDNGVFRQRTLSSTGAETTTPINIDGRYNLYVFAIIDKRLKKMHGLSLDLSTNIQFNQSHNFFEINHVTGYQNTSSGAIGEHLSVNWKDLITLDPQFNAIPSFTSYAGVGFNNVNNTSYSFNTPFNIFWPKRMNIGGTYSYNYSPLVAPGYQKSTNLLNVSIAREFLKKDRGELKLSCYDILNQAISANRNVYENIINDTQSQILKRYFLLTLSFKFNKSTVKTPEKPAAKSSALGGRLPIFN